MFVSACGPGDASSTDGTTPGPDAQAEALGLAGPCWLDQVTVRNFGRVVFVGPLDLTPEVERIARGEHLPFRHDGTVFRNREHRLPGRPKAYYHEYVHPTPGITGPGPQRLVVGEDGDLNYTPDHYATFVPLEVACAVAGGMVHVDEEAVDLKRMAPQTGLEPVTR